MNKPLQLLAYIYHKMNSSLTGNFLHRGNIRRHQLQRITNIVMEQKNIRLPALESVIAYTEYLPENLWLDFVCTHMHGILILIISKPENKFNKSNK